jgi:ribulose-phosphate 3-epimerase
VDSIGYFMTSGQSVRRRTRIFHVIRINPSIASADPLALRDSLRRMGKIPQLHVDIEDGNFVPNITFGMAAVREIARCTTIPLDAHLLVASPGAYLADLSACGLAAVAVHYEAADYPLDLLGSIRNTGMRAGMALNFKTSAEALVPFAAALDYVIVMTAEPDARGMRFHPPMAEKIARARALLPEQVEVWADGGIGEVEIPLVAAAGADTVVVGRAVWGSADPAAACCALAASAYERREGGR